MLVACCGSNPNSEGTSSTRNPPLFVASKPQNRPTRCLDPRTTGHWSLGGAGGQPGPRTARANGGSTSVPRAKKIIFSKVVPRPLGMLKQVFLAHFEPVVARFGPWKIPKCLENGPFWYQKWVKNGPKTHFSKNDPGAFGMLKQVFWGHFEPVATCFGPWKIPECLENGRVGTKSGSKMGQKRVSPKVTLDHLGCSNKWF